MSRRDEHPGADDRPAGGRTVAKKSAGGVSFVEALKFIDGLVHAVGGRITARDIEVAKRISAMHGSRV